MELELKNNLTNDIEMNKDKIALDKIIGNVIDKSSDYILKALPIQDNLKDILIDVKASLKSKSFKKVISTVVTSSIREGLEIIGAPISIVKDINKLKDIAIKGGLKQLLSASIDIVMDKYIKGNLFGDITQKFADDMKQFIASKNFNLKIDNDINKLKDKQNEFKSLCSDWYKAYDKMDIEKINILANEINIKEKKILPSQELNKANNIIQNMTQVINNKKDKLSPMQFEICTNI
ncbi:MAG: hypothetical protein RSE41_06370 [Clostridia bacterium]